MGRGVADDPDSRVGLEMAGDGGSAAERVEPVAMSKRKQMEELEYRRRLGLAMERKQGQWKLK